MKSICCIVGSVATHYHFPADCFIIAADHGYELLQQQNITPHLAVGDFDSSDTLPTDIPIIRHPVEKDDTDTMLAVKVGLEQGYRVFLLYGCLGGARFEHSLANLQALAYIAEHGGIGFLAERDTVITAIKNSRISFDADETGDISVFCMGADAEGVTLKGLHYPLNNAVLTAAMPLGVSNQFEGVPADISVQNGTLHIVWHTSPQALVAKLVKKMKENSI